MRTVRPCPKQARRNNSLFAAGYRTKMDQLIRERVAFGGGYAAPAFITLLGSALLSAPARAQQSSGLRKVGVLFPGMLGEERERLISAGISSELGTEKVTLVV